MRQSAWTCGLGLAKTLLPRYFYRTVSVGGGPRAIVQVLAELDFIEEHKQHFIDLRKLGARYAREFVIIERQSNVGAGEGWGRSQGMTAANSGPEAGSGRLDKVAHQSRLLDEKGTALRDRYADFCPPVAALIDDALRRRRSGGLLAGMRRAMLPRQEIGADDARRFHSAIGNIAQLADFYHVRLITDAVVTRIDMLSSDEKLRVSFDRQGCTEKTLTAHTAHLNSGTTMVKPIAREDIQRYLYQGPMDPQAVRKFLGGLGLLGEDGKLLPGKRLGVGGTGLSCLDELLTAHEVMPLTEIDAAEPSGYKVSVRAKESYRESLFVASNTSGKFIPPRHAHDVIWPFEEEPFGLPEELHALFLHGQGEGVLQYWYPLAVASIAAPLGLTPAEVEQKNMGTEELLREQKRISDRYMKQMREAESLSGAAATGKIRQAERCSLYAGRRGAYLGTILGYGMTRDAGATAVRMQELAPHTYRHSYPRARALVNALTMPGSPVAENNAQLLEVLNTMMQDIMASPVQIHSLAPLLFEAGIARHVQASYSDFLPREGGGVLMPDASGECVAVDAFIVSEKMEHGADPANESLKDQFMPIDPALPLHGKVGMHRRLLTVKNKLSNVIDNSLNGFGGWLRRGKSRIGAFGFDLNNKDSAIHDAPGLACRNMAMVHLKAVDYPKPEAYLEQLYREFEVTDADYGSEARSFRHHFDEVVAKSVFLKAAAALAGSDRTLYGTLARQCRTPQQREAAFEECGRSGNPAVQKALRQYRFDMRLRPVYEPAPAREGKDRYVDADFDLHFKVYMRAYMAARKHAEGNLPSSAD